MKWWFQPYSNLFSVCTSNILFCPSNLCGDVRIIDSWQANCECQWKKWFDSLTIGITPGWLTDRFTWMDWVIMCDNRVFLQTRFHTVFSALLVVCTQIHRYCTLHNLVVVRKVWNRVGRNTNLHIFWAISNIHLSSSSNHVKPCLFSMCNLFVIAFLCMPITWRMYYWLCP